MADARELLIAAKLTHRVENDDDGPYVAIRTVEEAADTAIAALLADAEAVVLKRDLTVTSVKNMAGLPDCWYEGDLMWREVRP